MELANKHKRLLARILKQDLEWLDFHMPYESPYYNISRHSKAGRKKLCGWFDNIQEMLKTIAPGCKELKQKNPWTPEATAENKAECEAEDRETEKLYAEIERREKHDKVEGCGTYSMQLEDMDKVQVKGKCILMYQGGGATLYSDAIKSPTGWECFLQFARLLNGNDWHHNYMEGINPKPSGKKYGFPVHEFWTGS